MDSATLSYFSGDTLASEVWSSKYQMKDKQDQPLESTPDDMHLRLAREFAEVEYDYVEKEKIMLHHQRIYGVEILDNLSEFGKELYNRRTHQTKDQIVGEFFDYMKDFKHIVPQGSIMSNLGNNNVFGSLSNCFTIASPEDSYGGICRADEELVQLMKRRGGVGTTLNNLRPEATAVSNSAKSSTGAHSFMERFSDSTREVAQDGRRGALMLLMHVNHPDIFKFVTKKSDRNKVTGANVSVMFTDKFMQRVEDNKDFLCTFPIDIKKDDLLQTVEGFNKGETITGILNPTYDLQEYNKLYPFRSDNLGIIQVMKIKARELYDTFVEMAWSNGEPGAAFIDRIQDYCPDGVYNEFKPTKCNPCGEIWMGDYDACRLIAQNLFSIVDDPFTKYAEVNEQRLYEVSYMQQRMSDDLIDLEAEYIQRIIDKIEADPESIEVKTRELDMWKKIRRTTLAGRRTGNGITGLGDMLAAMGLKYDNDHAIGWIEEIMKIKMGAELDATIDMGILRGTFKGWEPEKEFSTREGDVGQIGDLPIWFGDNTFYQMLIDEFPNQARRMYKYGRRNVSWSTVAPTGTVSLMTQTTSGIEPVFKAFYTRRRKITRNDTDRIDFTDQNGDQWQEYSVLHPKFRNWIEIHYPNTNLDSKQELVTVFAKSPYQGSQAENISWEKRIEMQAIIQKYTSNSISSTINLPEDVSQEVVHDIYLKAWKEGLKGITVYREGSRTGVLVSDTKLTNCDDFGYTDAIKRPKELEADYHHVISKGKSYAVIVGKLNGNPYELFAFSNPLRVDQLQGKIIKVESGIYQFQSEGYTIDNLQLNSDHTDEKLLTRWVSLLLRHGASPKFIAEQVEKSQVQVVSFPKVVARILKKYIADDITGEICSSCGSKSIIYTEGCKKCTNCGDSKC